MSELKPCPFCGSTDVAANSYSIEASVRCFDCFAVIVRKHPKYSDGGLVAAITAWNTRATDALLREAMEALGAALLWTDEEHDVADFRDAAEATLAKLRAHLEGVAHA